MMSLWYIPKHNIATKFLYHNSAQLVKQSLQVQKENKFKFLRHQIKNTATYFIVNLDKLIDYYYYFQFR